jgi:beta-lactamase superfamily II metal-dependent hydrolase
VETLRTQMTLQATFWDVQHGSATWLSMPNNENVLIDLGSGSFGAGEKFSPLRHMKHNCGVRVIDGLVITHQHYDHIADIENLAAIDLEPRVLMRPKLEERFIREANLRKLAEAAVDIYENIDARYNSAAPHSPFSADRPDVVEYAGVKLLLPGDNEGSSWHELLERPDFRSAIAGTHAILAAHHGRENGFYGLLFDEFQPLLTIISDGRFCDTSATSRYGAVTRGWTVRSRANGNSQPRKCLTTRKDGDIILEIGKNQSGKGYLAATIS